MRTKMERHQLTINRVYYIMEDGLYAWTPDGVGFYWFDTFEEAIEEMGWTPKTYPHFIININGLEDF